SASSELGWDEGYICARRRPKVNHPRQVSSSDELIQMHLPAATTSIAPPPRPSSSSTSEQPHHCRSCGGRGQHTMRGLQYARSAFEDPGVRGRGSPVNGAGTIEEDEEGIHIEEEVRVRGSPPPHSDESLPCSFFSRLESHPPSHTLSPPTNRIPLWRHGRGWKVAPVVGHGRYADGKVEEIHLPEMTIQTPATNPIFCLRHSPPLATLYPSSHPRPLPPHVTVLLRPSHPRACSPLKDDDTGL
ncbi:hypothetical protein R3P38DRAFT_3479799, partial [Favolaschia claudopus]